MGMLSGVWWSYRWALMAGAWMCLLGQLAAQEDDLAGASWLANFSFWADRFAAQGDDPVLWQDIGRETEIYPYDEEAKAWLLAEGRFDKGEAVYIFHNYAVVGKGLRLEAPAWGMWYMDWHSRSAYYKRPSKWPARLAFPNLKVFSAPDTSCPVPRALLNDVLATPSLKKISIARVGPGEGLWRTAPISDFLIEFHLYDAHAIGDTLPDFLAYARNLSQLSVPCKYFHPHEEVYASWLSINAAASDLRNVRANSIELRGGVGLATPAEVLDYLLDEEIGLLQLSISPVSAVFADSLKMLSTSSPAYHNLWVRYDAWNDAEGRVQIQAAMSGKRGAEQWGEAHIAPCLLLVDNHMLPSVREVERYFLVADKGAEAIEIFQCPVAFYEELRLSPFLYVELVEESAFSKDEMSRLPVLPSSWPTVHCRIRPNVLLKAAKSRYTTY